MQIQQVCSLGARVTAQVKNAAGQWVAADPIPGTLVCNIGDMLRVWTHGLYQVRGQRPRTQARASPSFSTCIAFSRPASSATEPCWAATTGRMRSHCWRYECKRMHSSMAGRGLALREPGSTTVPNAPMSWHADCNTTATRCASRAAL